MTCYYPNDAYISGVRSTGTKIISFGLPKQANQETLQLQCGQCSGCRLDYSQQWAIRIMHEAQINEDKCQFITLTYSDEHLPYDGSLTKSHIQKFLKRLRKAYPAKKIRYYYCGEYGDQLKRPHYHMCLFGHAYTDLDIHNEVEGIYTYVSPILEQQWGKGFCTVQDLTIGNAAYCARYILKKQTGEKKHEHYEKVCEITGEIRQIQPEYSDMSRRPGIAKEWYDKYHKDIFPYDTTIYRGKNVKTPRYYENLLRSTDLSTFDQIKADRKAKAQDHLADQTPERLRAREKVKLASMRNHKRILHET